MGVFTRLGIFTEEEINSITAIEFNPVRVGFKTDTSAEALAIPKGEPGHQFELYTKDVLEFRHCSQQTHCYGKSKIS